MPEAEGGKDEERGEPINPSVFLICKKNIVGKSTDDSCQNT